MRRGPSGYRQGRTAGDGSASDAHARGQKRGTCGAGCMGAGVRCRVARCRSCVRALVHRCTTSNKLIKMCVACENNQTHFTIQTHTEYRTYDTNMPLICH